MSKVKHLYQPTLKNPMSLEIGEKFRRIREAEGLGREAFSDITGIPVGTLRGIEGGKHEPSFAVIQKLALSERTQKYALWLLSSETHTVAGQTVPGETKGAGVPIDQELLELLLLTVEQILKDRKMNLSPAKKSKLIAYLYAQYSQEEDIEIDRPSVIRLIDVAA
jgi:transcriptional regulator with XRE-family HTH domain